LQEEVSSILRDAPGSRRQVAARVTATKSPTGNWNVDLVTETEGATRRRSFDTESCAAVEAAVALILAIAINPETSPPPERASIPGALTSGSATPSPATPSPTTPKTPGAATMGRDAEIASSASGSQAQSSTSAAATGSIEPRGGSLGISASGALDVKTLPAPAVGVELALEWRRGAIGVEIGGAYWAPENATGANGPAGARFHLLSGEARASYGWQLGRLRAAPLVGVHLAELRAAGFGGTVANFEPSEVFVGIGVGGSLAWRLTERLEVRLALEGLRWLSRPTFVVVEPEPTSPTTINRPSVVVARAQLGVTVRFF
jgi:hypothetical protein